jgi:hypothetical protein
LLFFLPEPVIYLLRVVECEISFSLFLLLAYLEIMREVFSTRTEYEGFDKRCPISLSFKGRKTSIFGICSEILV